MQNQFLTNYTETTFLQKIKDNLRRCKSFDFSVSFIKKAGLILLYRDIDAALARGCKGRMITSTYQNFTDIDSLRSFLKLMNNYPNFQCHLDDECFHDSSSATLGYHSKGYLFQFDDYVEVIVGSSNITRYALLKNIEWDVVVQESVDTPVFQQAMNEYEQKWEKTKNLDEDAIKYYSEKLNYAIERWDMDYDLSIASIKPNYLQRKALKELNRFREMGTNRALVIAASGSGKTYLAAFDALSLNPNRLLYIVHEGSILKKSMQTFQEVFGNKVTYGMYTGQNKEIDKDFVFATNISMCNSLELFSKDEFDYIVIDECHHATAETYKKIIDYFQPEFLLGLTATPERMDNEDVFELFKDNVPYELRLRDAILNGLVVPFHYYGIRDKMISYGLEGKQERQMIAQQATPEHADFIFQQIEAHRPQGKLKALAFCRNISHAQLMSEALSEYYHTAYLSGHNSVGERIRAYKDLQSDDGPTEILFSVDILNEGVDIPGVNMVLFLRPTESSTVFIQQLGRGLRKYPDKPFVTVLDFIGNSYKRSVQIAFALSSLSENFVAEKRLMESMVKDNFEALGLKDSGVEIQIDQLSKEEILHSIESENFNSIKYLKQDYFNFKKYINSEYYPKHMDYLNNDCAPDLIRFMSIKINGKKTGSYYNFLRGINETDLPPFNDTEIDFIGYLSSLLPLVRPHEYEIIRCLLSGITDINQIDRCLEERIVGYRKEELDHAFKFLKFISITDQEVSLTVPLNEPLREYLNDLLEYGITRFTDEYGTKTGFKLWFNYRMDQVQLKLLQNPGYNQLGTYYLDNYVIIFASLNKDLAEEDKLNYKDKFLEADVFQWESKRKLSSSELKKLKNSHFAYLFIRKMAGKNGVFLPFTYVGKGKLTNDRSSENGNGTYLFDILMDNKLPDYLQYDFELTSGNKV